jgi:hypothetical protein
LAIAKRQLAIEEAEMNIKEKELMVRNAELNRKLRSNDLLNDEVVRQAKNKETSGQHSAEDKEAKDMQRSDDMQRSVNKCSWPDCSFGVNLTTEACQKCGVNFLHHPCQTEWEYKQGLVNQELRKLCYPCAKTFVIKS